MRLQRHNDGTRTIALWPMLMMMTWPNAQRRTWMCRSYCWLFTFVTAFHLCIGATVMVSGGAVNVGGAGGGGVGVVVAGVPAAVANVPHDNFMPNAESSVDSDGSLLLPLVSNAVTTATAITAADEFMGAVDIASVTDAIEGNQHNYLTINSDNIKNNNNDVLLSGGMVRQDNTLTTFSTPLHKEVVDQLIKQWAPIVWLAPEEKFLPLGVDEFLNHVHATGDKGNTFMPGMPIGDSSTKAFLVTNAEIEDLLKDDNSFIYGRNPNETPVPIYAVVSLCGARSSPTQVPYDKAAAAMPFAESPMPPAPQPPPAAATPLRLSPVGATQTANVIHSTRGPYIPVSIDPLDERNNTLRRSSRLYPVFKRMQRNAPANENAMYAPPLRLPMQQYAAESRLSIGETNRVAVVPVTTVTPDPTAHDDAADAQVNNFIANLADNVKFSGVSGSGNTIDANSAAQYDGNSYNAPQDAGTYDERPQPTRQGEKIPSFHVTYWMFYPYSQGKSVCTLSLGPLGRIPFPAVYGYCLGKRRDIGSHIGDWEHMSLYFNGATEPEAMYVSAHDAGAYYSYNQLTGSFEYKKQETRKGILQRPNFPKTVTTFNSHPVLFAAKGSHGLWTAPGKHRFVKVARLYDINGFGTPWNTWKFVDITYKNLKSYGRSLLPSWLSFKGKWGNPKSKCHPFRRIGLNFCEYTDGPTGIPLKEPHFQCGATYR